MIARMWHGYTKPEDADAYESTLKPELLPGIGKVPGYRGGYVLRRLLEGEVEFVTIMIWDSIDALKAVAGSNYTVKQGDTLYHIAKVHYGNGNQWQRIANANPGISPTSLKVGQVLVMP